MCTTHTKKVNGIITCWPASPGVHYQTLKAGQHIIPATQCSLFACEHPFLLFLWETRKEIVISRWCLLHLVRQVNTLYLLPSLWTYMSCPNNQKISLSPWEFPQTWEITWVSGNLSAFGNVQPNTSLLLTMYIFNTSRLKVVDYWSMWPIQIGQLCLSFYPRSNISDRFPSPYPDFIRIQIFQMYCLLVFYLYEMNTSQST